MKVYYLFLFTLLFSCDEKNKPLYSEERNTKKNRNFCEDSAERHHQSPSLVSVLQKRKPKL